jgi:hypothetical protein
MTDMRRRCRLKFETEEAILRAVRMRGGLLRAKPAEVVNAALEAYLAAEIAEARKQLEADACGTGEVELDLHDRIAGAK